MNADCTKLNEIAGIMAIPEKASYAVSRLHCGCTVFAPRLHFLATLAPDWSSALVAVWWQLFGHMGYFGVLRRGMRIRADRSVSLQDSIRGPASVGAGAQKDPASGGDSVAVR
jgi:hypothetical protein